MELVHVMISLHVDVPVTGPPNSGMNGYEQERQDGLLWSSEDDDKYYQVFLSDVGW